MVNKETIYLNNVPNPHGQPITFSQTDFQVLTIIVDLLNILYFKIIIYLCNSKTFGYIMIFELFKIAYKQSVVNPD